MPANDLGRRRLLRRAALLAAGGALGPACAGRAGSRPGRASAAQRRGAGEARALSFAEYRSFDGLGLAELVARGELQPLQLLTYAARRARAVNPQLNALAEDLLRRGREEIGAGLPDGPFRGVPFLLKDLGMYWEGTVTTNGSRLASAKPAAFTSVLVERCRAAGLVIFGKTTSPEFGGAVSTESRRFGQTCNPWSLAHTPGGSSGGSAALVAAGVLPFAQATDAAGSIRVPASCCGLFGLKPTRARTPLGPSRLAGGAGMVAAHAVTRSVRDSAALLDATRGPEPGSPYVAPAPPESYRAGMQKKPGRLRIAVVRESIMRGPTHADCAAALEDAAGLCESLGHEVVDAQLPAVSVEELSAGISRVFNTGLRLAVERIAAARGRPASERDLERVTWDNYQNAKRYGAHELMAAQQLFHQMGRAMARFQRRFDVVLSPTLAAPPARLGEWSLDQDPADFARTVPVGMGFSVLYNITGQPAMSVPLHWNADGLPIGVMFAGRFGDEMTLFRLAAQLERARPWFERVAPL